MNRLKHIAGGASLAFLLTITAGTGLVLLAVVVLELCDSLLRTNQPPSPGYSESLAVTERGTPLIIRRQSPPVSEMKAFDLAREPIAIPPGELTRPAHLPAELRQDQWLRASGIGRRVEQVAADPQAGEFWYLVFDGNRSRRFYLQGVNRQHGKTIGYIGRDGFQADKPAGEDRFLRGPMQLRAGVDWVVHVDHPSQGILLDDRQLLSVDFQSRSIEPLIEGSLLSMDRLDTRVSIFGYATSGSPVWAARTSEQVGVWDWKEGVRQTFSIPGALRDRRFDFFPLEEEGFYLVARPGGESDGGEVTRQFELIRATASGEVAERTSVALSRTSSSRSEGGLSDEGATRIVVACVPAAVWSLGASLFIPAIETRIEEDLTFSQAFSQWAGTLWWVVLPVLGFCGWLAWRTFLHQRRHGEADGWFWAVFVFLFGLPGYLGYRLHRSWPYNEPIPAPKPTGLEVFAPGYAKPSAVH